MNNSIRLGLPLLGLAASAIFLGGCADESPWGSASAKTGSINVSFSADYSFDTAKPIFRSSDDSRAQGDENDLSTYINLPELEDFSFKLVSKDGTSEKVWTNLSAFEDALKTEKFSAGIYTLTAYYGEKGKQGVDCPYFEANSTFTVLAGRETKIDLTAELKNSMVKINYSDGFKDYMSAYSASVLSGGDKIDAGAVSEENDVVDTDKVIFVEPEDTEIAVDFTTRITGQSVSGLVVGKFATLAKTLHNVTLDVTDGDNGFAQLTVTFEENYVDKEEIIDLTETLYTTPPPTISCSGFSNGETINLYGDAAVDVSVSMSVLARGGIKKAIFGVIAPDGYVTPWGSAEIDLHDAANTSAMSNFGVIAKGFDSEDESNAMATLDLTSFARNLPQGAEYIVYLTVTDIKNQASDPVKVVLNTEAVSAMLAKDESQNSLTPDIIYGSDVAELTLDFNGENPRDVSFQAQNENGTLQDVTAELVSYEQIATATRAFSTKRCLYRVSLPYSTCSEVTVSAKYKGAVIQSFTLPVAVPEYSISEVDAFATHAHLKVTTPNLSDLPLVMSNIKLKFNDSYFPLASETNANEGYGILTVSNLASTSSAGTSYVVKSTITDGDVWNDAKFPNNSNSFTTEAMAGVPNGDFEDLTESINTTINQGGKWTQTSISTAKRYQTTLSIIIKEPEQWCSSNSITCNLNATNLNSWYVIPSVFNTTLSWISNQPEAKVGTTGQSAYTSTADVYKNLSAVSGKNAMVIRNVAWDINGVNITDDQKTGDRNFSNYYCSKEPSSIGNRSAGYLKLGNSLSEGVSFKSRPIKLSGHYMYIDDTNESGVIHVKLLNGTKVIGSGSKTFGHQETYTTFEIPIVYNETVFAPKATKLQIEIFSSNANTIVTKNYCNKDECCSRGAALFVDNLTFEY